MSTDDPAVGAGLGEADCHGRGGDAAHAADDNAWARVPRLSTGEVVWALRHLGVHAQLAEPDHVSILHRGVDIAKLPLRDALHPGIVRALLHTIGVSLEEMLRVLDIKL